MIAPFLISVFAFVWLFVGQVLYENINLIWERQISFSVVMKLLALHVPWALGMALPLAVLFGASLSVNRLARDSEITSARMSGVPVFRIFLPILVVGAVVSVLAFWMGERVTPKANREIRETMRYIVGMQPVPILQENVFFSSQGYYFYVGRVDRSAPGTVKLENVMLYESPPPGELPMLVTAKWATSNNDLWTLHDGVTHKLGPDGLTQFELKFPEMQLNLKQAMQDLWNTQKTTEEMNAGELEKQIALFGGSGRETRQMLVDWHFKLSIPLSCFIFALCAAPLSLRFARYGSYSGLFMSIVIMFLYRINIVWGQLFGLSGKVPPFIAGWSQDIIFGLLGLYLIWQEE